MERPEDALEFTGFESCASDREFWWHLAADEPGKWDRFPAVTAWEWRPSQDCDLRPFRAEEVVTDMVENGGWLLIGDSVTELQFFSLSCLLYPHVRATPNYTENPYFDRAWPQNLYLSPSSPLLPTLSLPPSFNISSTPLVTFRRVDLLLSKDELIELYDELYPPSPTSNPNSKPNSNSEPGERKGKGNETLFSDERFWSLSPHEYMDIFLSPLPHAHYTTLIISTAGHWTTTLLRAFRDEEVGEEKGYGVERMLPFFREAMRRWAEVVQGRLSESFNQGGGESLASDDSFASDGENVGGNSGNGRLGGKGRTRQVIVRAYLPGHEDCHSHREPWKEWVPFKWKFYNWPWIGEFNRIFQDVLSSPSYPDIHFLPIDRPGLLRPDAHVAGDCLHIMTGAGVIEGWTHYIWQYVTREIPGRIR
ncbi:hypothetical protein K474DRAFT_1605797 [Panus rudis PR-1116 ss-1]|nr:hypothetical protein K474DRAFT_1605797 [Panus rudis PR-1116 ss-1]